MPEAPKGYYIDSDGTCVLVGCSVKEIVASPKMVKYLKENSKRLSISPYCDILDPNEKEQFDRAEKAIAVNQLAAENCKNKIKRLLSVPSSSNQQKQQALN